VLLGSRAVAGNGSWSNSTTTQAAAVPSGVLPVTLAPSSAALVTVSPRTAPLEVRAKGLHARGKRTPGR
jgi:hypothetical protein